MEILYEKSFLKDISKINDNTINLQLLELIELLKKANNLFEISSVKKIKGSSNYYRIKIRDYRIGLKQFQGKIILIRFLNRKDIYKYFP